MKNTGNRTFFIILRYFLDYLIRRKTLHFLLIVMIFSSLAFCNNPDDILFQMQKKGTVNYSSKIKIIVKTPFSEQQVFDGEQVVSGNNRLIDFSKQKGLIFLKTATADYQFSSDGITQEGKNSIINQDYTLEKMVENYQFQIMNVSDQQVILAGFSQDRQIGNIKLYIDKPEYLLRKIEINKENSDELIRVENSYFEGIVNNQKITVSSSGIVVGIEINCSDIVINPLFPKDYFEIKRLLSLVKNIEENGHE